MKEARSRGASMNGTPVVVLQVQGRINCHLQGRRAAELPYRTYLGQVYVRTFAAARLLSTLFNFLRKSLMPLDITLNQHFYQLHFPHDFLHTTQKCKQPTR
jgi:hypothetical protein